MNIQRLIELREMDYQDYLKTPEWQEIRREALRRAKNRCQICNSSDYLHVHHRTYENKGDEDLSDLTVLCSDCHQIFHQAGKIVHDLTDSNEYKPWYTDKEFMRLIKY